MNAGSKAFHDYCDERIAAGEPELDRSDRQHAMHNYYTLRNAAIQKFGLAPDTIVGSDLLAAAFLSVKPQLIFIQPKHEPTQEEIRAERARRLEAENNIGPTSRRSDPRKMDGVDGSEGTLKEFIQRAVGNLDKVARGEVTPQDKPKTRPFRTIPKDITSEELRNSDYTSAEIRDYLARRPKQPQKQ